MLGGLCDDGEERYGGGAGADDDHVFPRVIEVRGPELWVHDCALEVVQSGDLDVERLGVIIVARAHDAEVRGEGLGLTVGGDLEVPELVG